jgi:hypothetical protein
VTGGIYLLRGEDDLVEMNESPYDSEDVLQTLLAKYPSLLAGDQLPGDEPRRWLLIRREAAVPSAQDGVARWSIDHLFFDQGAVPTIVEVKRSSDSRIRREVVGQMLDYAANAVVYWPIETLRATFETRCQEEGKDSEAEVIALLGLDADPEEFWKRAEVNLQAGRVRLVFVADVVPSELRRVVEFLNSQMNPAEVLAIEVKQFVGEGLKTLVPRVIGQTAEAELRKRPRGEGRRWDRQSFVETLREQHGADAVAGMERLLAWAERRQLRRSWGRGKVDGSFIPVLDANGRSYFPICAYTYGKVEVQFMHMNQPPFDDLNYRGELLRKLNTLPGVGFPPDAITRRPRIPLSQLGTDPTLAAGFEDVLDWVIETAQAWRADDALTSGVAGAP